MSLGWRGALHKDLTAWDRPLLSATTVAAPNNYPAGRTAVNTADYSYEKPGISL
jgi:hypothetical protein